MNPAKFARWLHLGHRWLGMTLGLMLLLWFVSGVVMLFVARPQLTDAERLAAVQAAIAAEPQPVHIPRERPPMVVLDEGPLVLVETRRDLRDLTLPFDAPAADAAQA